MVNTKARGYGVRHQELRNWWRPYVDTGTIECRAVICLEERDGKGRLIRPGTPWDLGHTVDKRAYTGPEHERCNRSEGATRGNRMRGLRRGRKRRAPVPLRKFWEC